MAKRSAERSNNHGISLSRVNENKKLSLADDNLLLHNNKPTQKLRLIKSESSPSLFLSNGIEEKVSRDSKKPIKTIRESEKIRPTSSVRLSQFVIVDSVLKDSNIDSNLDASLPPSLHSIYQKFINDKTLIDHFQAKDEFYRGVGLLGIGIEERIYNKRKILEESLKRSFRLRSNPKPKRQFDGTLITRALKNRSKLTQLNDVKTEKVKYNVFTIGNDSLKKGSRRQAIRKSVKKSSSLKRPVANSDNDDEEDAATTGDNSNDTRSIALSRTKRQPKVPQLDFKYCYSEGFVSRPRKLADTRSKVEDQFMEIVDSDSSSSVVEVFPQPTQDKENSEVQMSSKGVRKQWRPRDNSNRALNLLDKLRLGLQCTVIQTERDVIIENLTVDDLSTLRSRLQGLATFKNIEAEYDKNGQETARATIDRRVLNLPATETRQSVAARRCQNVPVAASRASENGPGEDRAQRWVRPKVRTVKKVRKLYTQCASTPNILARAPTTPARPDQSQTRPSDGPGPATAPVSFYPQITSVVMEPAHEQIVVKAEPLAPQMPPVTTLDTVPSITAVASTTTAATAMSASQLLMLRKGGPPPPGNDVPVTATTAISIAGNEQIFANQILKPFKKAVPASSPSKLEIDDEEAEECPATAPSPLPLPLATVTTATTIKTVPSNGIVRPIVRHRKWTHNFLTSSSVNFREVLCAAGVAKTAPMSIATIPVTIATAPVTIATTTDQVGPAKGSNAVLKSLLEGAHTPPPPPSTLPSQPSPLYLLGGAVPVAHDNKIKWQLGGSLLPTTLDSPPH